MVKVTANGNSTENISTTLLNDIAGALKNIRGWGSVEIFVQNYKVVQITERNITKTQHIIEDKANS